MNCQAKIQEVPWDKHTNRCECEATTKVTIVKSGGKKTKCLCNLHRHRYVAKYRYEAKHCYKPCEIIEEKL